jgi:hypothetical protein
MPLANVGSGSKLSGIGSDIWPDEIGTDRVLKVLEPSICGLQRRLVWSTTEDVERGQ